MGITHATAATGTDSGDGKISKNAWNEDHVGGFSDPMTSAGDLIYEGGAGDLALSKSVTVSSTGNGLEGSNAVDGNASTQWRSAYGVAGQWIRVDLTSAYSIGSFRVLNSSETGRRWYSYKIQSSTNDTDWTDRHTVAAVAPVDSGVVELSSGPISARWWRFYSTAGTWTDGSEGYGGDMFTFQIFGAVAPARLPIGSDNYVLRVDGSTPAWEAEFDATVPVTQASSDAAATGSATTAARRDHRHGMPALAANVLTTTGDIQYMTGGTDLAPLYGNASSNGGTNGDHPYSHAIDGDITNTRWRSSTEGAAVNGNYLRVDLQAAYSIRTIRVRQTNITGDGNPYPGNTGQGVPSYVVQSSPDASSWTTRYTVSAMTNDTGTIDLGTDISARYWQVLATSDCTGNRWEIWCFVLGQAVVPDRLPVGPDNYVLRVATDRPVWEAEFDATAPTTQAFGDSAATGSAATAARRDHKHGMPSVAEVNAAAHVYAYLNFR